MNCPKCGKQINDTATFCPFCGQSVEEKQNIQVRPTPEKSSEGFKLTPAIILAGVSLLLCFLKPGLGIVTSIAGIVCGIVGMKNPNKKKWSKIGMIASICLIVGCFISLAVKSSSQTVKSNDTTAQNGEQNYAVQENNTDNNAGDDESSGKPNVASDDDSKSDVDTDDFTIMIYVVGSNLESGGGAATVDIGEMANAQYGDNVNVLLETGGATEWKNSIVSADKIQRFELTNGQLITKDEKQLVSMCQESELSDFISWGATNYPARRYGLVLWDHGGGVLGGYGVDELYPNDRLYIPNIASAVQGSGVHLEFIGFDACLMGCFESGYALKDCADYMIASEESEAGIGWYYTDWLSYIGKEPNAPMEDLGRCIVDGLVDTNEADEIWGKDSNKTATLALVDLSKMNSVYDAWKQYLSMSLENLKKGGFANQSKARVNARCYGDRPENNTYSDMVDMLDYINENALPGTFDIEKTIRECVVYTNSNISGSNGLSVYLPYYKPSVLSKLSIPMLKDIGFEDEYFEYFNTFCSTLISGNPDIEHEPSQTITEAPAEGPEVTMPDVLQIEDADGKSFVHFTKDQLNTISSIELEYANVNETHKEEEGVTILDSFGSDLNPFTLTDEGDLIVDYDGRFFMLYNSTGNNSAPEVAFPYAYLVDSGTYEDGTWYTLRYAPMVLNDKTDIEVLLYCHFKSYDNYSGEVLGYVIEDGSNMADRVVYDFEIGDVIGYSDYYYILEESPGPLYSEPFKKLTINDKNGLYFEYFHNEDAKGKRSLCYRFVVTDIYQKRHYTGWRLY